MNIKTLGLECLFSISLIHAPIHAMQSKHKQQKGSIDKAIAPIVGIGASAALIYFAPRIFQALEPDKFVIPTYAVLYKKPRAREYRLVVADTNKIIHYSIRFLPWVGLHKDEFIFEVDSTDHSYTQTLQRTLTAATRYMILAKPLSTKDNPAMLNLSSRGLKQIIEEYENSECAVFSWHPYQ